MSVNYLYIDDDSSQRASGTVLGFTKGGVINVELNQPKSTWEQQQIFIADKQLDGLILDLRLDDYANIEDGTKANFRGTSLAQEIRTRQKEGILKDFPIVLFSANDKVMQSLDNSGKDLFDICFKKDSITSDEIFEKQFIPQLYALSNGYYTIKEFSNDLQKTLNVDTDFIDDRFLAELSNLTNNPPHIIAHFVIEELILRQGLLINERVLGARLGIDIENSQDWDKVIESLTSTKYNGVFNEGWQRWWMPLVENWWNEVIQAETYLRSTPATERVELIKSKLNLNDIQPAQKIEKADSEDFWTVCKGYNRPLDTIDGLVIDGQENLYPWQEPEYVSVEAALNRKNIEDWVKVAKLEMEHLKELQKIYQRVR